MASMQKQTWNEAIYCMIDSLLIRKKVGCLLLFSMIDISRGFKQVSLPDDFAQTAWENWKFLRFSIKVN
jgi:hypothetical protein